jgi:pantetheine-phosphate adenylyltransferase
VLILQTKVIKIMNMVKAVFPGSFDPPTNGHLNLIKRGSQLFDSLDVVISVNHQKKYLLSPEERLSLIMRGVRAVDDFGYEFELSMLNKQLNPQVETIFLPTDRKYIVLRSSSIKELVQLGADVTKMIPSNVEKLLREKIFENNI